MKFNILYLITKQLRFSHWLYNKGFDVGTDIHALKKYHTIDPSVAEMVAKQHGGKLYPALVEKLRHHGHEVPEHLIEKPKPIVWDEKSMQEDIENRLKVVLAESKKFHEGGK